MEDILEIYESKPAEHVSRICFDERPCQLIGDIYSPIPMTKNKVKKVDNEYTRNGTCVALLAYDIDTGKRFIKITDTRKKEDYTKFIDEIERKHFKNVNKIILIQDNLNTHKYGSFYENLSITRASELRQKIEFHYTPIHASWLNMAEIEFSSLSRQCLNRRIATKKEMIKEVAIWEKQRNKNKVKIAWSFTVTNARDKMASKYHKVNSNY